MSKPCEQDFCIQLVQAVEKHPCLYNFRLSEYSRQDVVQKAWIAVSREVNERVATCKEKWRNIRTVFVRHLKTEPNVGKRMRTYYLNDLLQFILPFVKNSVSDSTGNEPPSPDNQVFNADSKDERRFRGINEKNENIFVTKKSQSIADESTSWPENSEVHPVAKVIPERGLKRKRFPEIDRTLVDYCDRRSATFEDDPTYHFLISLIPDLHEMNSQQMRCFKRKVLHLVEEILEDEITSHT